VLESIWNSVRGLTDWMVSFASPDVSLWYGGGALFGFAFAESSFFPIPPDALLIALCLTERALGSWPVALYYALMCSLASVLGGVFGYVIGLKGGRPLLERLFAQEKIAAVDRAFERHGVWAVAVAGFTPIPYKIFTISSGAFRLSLWRFSLASALSRSARFFLVAVACMVVGPTVKDWLKAHATLFTVLFLAALVAGFLAVKLVAGRCSQADPSPQDPPQEANDD